MTLLSCSMNDLSDPHQAYQLARSGILGEPIQLLAVSLPDAEAFCATPAWEIYTRSLALDKMNAWERSAAPIRTEPHRTHRGGVET